MIDIDLNDMINGFHMPPNASNINHKKLDIWHKS